MSLSEHASPLFVYTSIEKLSELKLSPFAVKDTIGILSKLCIKMHLDVQATLGINCIRTNGVYCYLHIPQVHLPQM